MELLKKEMIGSDEMDEVKEALTEVRLGRDEVKSTFAQIVQEEEKKVAEALERGREVGGSGRTKEREVQIQVLEMMERTKRRNNLILMGIPEEGKDGEGSEIVQDVVNGLMTEKVEYEVMGRIGVKGSKPRPIRIRVGDIVQKRKILASAKKLKNTVGMERIYIVPDLTWQQQEEDKKLREEVRQKRAKGEVNVRIIRGEVVSGELVKAQGKATVN